MKSLYEHLQRTLGFTADDELAAEYLGLFQSNDPIDSESDLSRADLWMSLGERLRAFVLETSKFTGALGMDDGQLTIYRYTPLKDVQGIIGDALDNTFHYDGPNKDWDFYTLKYKGMKPVDIQDIDPEVPETWEGWVHPKKKWKNMLEIKGLEWIIMPLMDKIWWRGMTCIKELKEYTGWEFYQNGIRIK